MTPPSAPLVLERIYPDDMDRSNRLDRDCIEIHEARYRFAASHLVGERVLDLACGSGFGTALMARRHPDKQFTGVDIDARAIAYARERYPGENLHFLRADAMQLRTLPVDCIVSLETIEHLPQPGPFVARLPLLLAPAGRVIASVPVTPTRDGNPHHLHDFSRRSFHRLFRRNGFVVGEGLHQQQKWIYHQAFARSEPRASRAHGVGHNVLTYYRRHPWALFSRLHSLLVNGPCNIYLTRVFDRAC